MTLDARPPSSASDGAVTATARALTMLQDFLPFIVIGIATGSVYGLAGHRAGPDLQDVGDLQLRLRVPRRPLRLRLLLPPHRARDAVAPGPRPLPLRARARSKVSAWSCCARILEPATDTLKVVATVGPPARRGRASGSSGTATSARLRSRVPATKSPSAICRGQRGLGPDHRGDHLGARQRRRCSTSSASCGWGAAMRGVVDNPDWCR